MTGQPTTVSRRALLDYFLGGAVPRGDFKVGMELEKMGRDPVTGLPLPYEGARGSVRGVLEWFLERRGGDPVFEANHLIGVDAPWGSLTLEPGGQVEWSSRARATLGELHDDMQAHLEELKLAGDALGIRWSDLGVDPELKLAAMNWMPKARYKIMRTFLPGRLAHRMMTQTASIQCAFDYSDPEDWRRKFKAAAILTPVAGALFANSSRLEGKDSGYRAYRHAIWQETDPNRCGLPPVVFQPDFDMEAWLDWVLSVPTIFRHRGRGLVPAGGPPFITFLDGVSGDAARREDWETHASTIFTDVRSYTYIEVRSADLQPDERVFAVPSFWTGILYNDDALGAATEMASAFDNFETWAEAMRAMARSGLDAEIGGVRLGELAASVLGLAVDGLRRGAACAGDGKVAIQALERLAEHNRLEIRT